MKVKKELFELERETRNLIKLFELEQRTRNLIDLIEEYENRYETMSYIEDDYNTVKNSLSGEDMTTKEKQYFNNIKDNMAYLRNHIQEF